MSAHHDTHAIEHAVKESVEFVLSQYPNLWGPESRALVADAVEKRVKAHLARAPKRDQKVEARRKAQHRGVGRLPAEVEIDPLYDPDREPGSLP